MKTRFYVMIFGKVQGVFFRDGIKNLANMLEIKGWVRNKGNEVEALFEGDQKNIEKILEFCRKGPKEAIVENLEIKKEDYTGEFKDFEIRY